MDELGLKMLPVVKPVSPPPLFERDGGIAAW